MNKTTVRADHQDEILVAKIQPMWDDTPKHISTALVRFAD